MPPTSKLVGGLKLGACCNPKPAIGSGKALAPKFADCTTEPPPPLWPTLKNRLSGSFDMVGTGFDTGAACCFGCGAGYEANRAGLAGRFGLDASTEGSLGKSADAK